MSTQPARQLIFGVRRREVLLFHFHYVGDFDPHDSLDLSVCPITPKAKRPPSRESANLVLAKFDAEIAEYVWHDENGYVGCDWSAAPAA